MMYTYNAKIINIVDGDTVDAEIDLGFKLYTVQRLRLIDIDTEEMNDPDQNLKDLARSAKKYMQDNLLGKTVKINTYKSDSFGRYLVEIYIDKFNVNDYLLESGLAKKWKK